MLPGGSALADFYPNAFQVDMDGKNWAKFCKDCGPCPSRPAARLSSAPRNHRRHRCAASHLVLYHYLMCAVCRAAIEAARCTLHGMHLVSTLRSQHSIWMVP